MADDVKGKILTVGGPIDPEELGTTLIHEHLFFDLSCYYQPPQDERGKRLTDQPVELSNLGWIRQNLMGSRPNLVMDDEGAQARIEPVYEAIDGWTESTAGARSWADLPANCIKYVERVEELIEAPVALLSTSPEREDTILMKDPFED